MDKKLLWVKSPQLIKKEKKNIADRYFFWLFVSRIPVILN